MYDSNNFCDAVQFSGASDYTRIAHFQQLPTYSLPNTNYNTDYSTIFNYGTNYNQNNLTSGILNIFGALGSILVTKDQAKMQQQYQMMQYQTYMNQSEQFYQQQQQQSFMTNIATTVKLMKLLEEIDKTDSSTKEV
jgi:hypothetical protein